MEKTINSIENNKIKVLRRLLDKPRERKKQGLYTAEGPKLFLEAPEGEIREVFVSEGTDLQPRVREKLARLRVQEKARVYMVDGDLFRRITDTLTPQGIVTVLALRDRTPQDLIETVLAGGNQAFLLLLEAIRDPGNAGTIIRSAEAAGADGVLLSTDCVDIYSPKVVRASAGSIFRLPCAVAEDLPAIAQGLADRGVKVYAGHLQAGGSHTHMDFTGGTAILIGNEGRGLSPELADRATNLLHIPMEGEVESLNAAIAATIIMYEVHRQRH